MRILLHVISGCILISLFVMKTFDPLFRMGGLRRDNMLPVRILTALSLGGGLGVAMVCRYGLRDGHIGGLVEWAHGWAG